MDEQQQREPQTSRSDVAPRPGAPESTATVETMDASVLERAREFHAQHPWVTTGIAVGVGAAVGANSRSLMTRISPGAASMASSAGAAAGRAMVGMFINALLSQR